MWSAGHILHDEFRRQIFEAPHRISGKFGEPAEWSLLERGGEHRTPQCLISCVEGHLCFKDVHVLIWISGAIVGFDG